MAFHLRKDEQGTGGFRRILLEQVDSLCTDLQRANRVEAVHEARKRCKRIRAVVRLLRPAAKAFYRRENRAFRDLAHALSALRDVDARFEAFVDVVKLERNGTKRFLPLRNLLKSESNRITKALVKKQLAGMVKKAQMAERRLNRSKWPDGDGFQLIKEGLHQSYRRGRRAMARAYNRDEPSAFHKWRKRVKDLGYQTQLLRELWPPILKRLQKELEELGDLLGQGHDLVVVRETLRKKGRGKVSPELLEAFEGLIERRTFELQAEAGAIGHRIYAESPKVFMRRIKGYWTTWQAETVASNKNEKPALLNLEKNVS